MQTLVCDGCGKSELLSKPEKNRDLKTVQLTVVVDTRETIMPNVNEKHEADICSECRTILLSRYFRIKEGRVLEIPTFLNSVKSA